MEIPCRELPLAQVTPGMVLAADLPGDAGQVLLPRGTVLTVALLASLPRHAVATLLVHDAVDARVERLFRQLDPHGADAWANEELKRYVTAWRNGGGA